MVPPAALGASAGACGVQATTADTVSKTIKIAKSLFMNVLPPRFYELGADVPKEMSKLCFSHKMKTFVFLCSLNVNADVDFCPLFHMVEERSLRSDG